MTIKEAAEMYSVSPQAIYQRLKKNGVDVRTIKNKDGSLTDQGVKMLESLFDKTTVTGGGDERQEENKRSQTEYEADKGIGNELNALHAEIESLKTQLETAKGEIDFLRQALLNSQQLQAMTMKALPPADQAQHKGLFARMTERFRKQPNDQTNETKKE